MAIVAQIVEELIRRKPFLLEALSKGIVNNAALADELIPEIEKKIKKRVTFAAVNMAIRRLSEKLERSFVERPIFDKNSDVLVRSDLVEITIYLTHESEMVIKKLYGIIEFRKGDILTITQGIHEVTLITNKRHQKKILDLFDEKVVKMVIKNLGSVTIKIPDKSIETIGLFYVATRTLNWENINIIEIVSTLTELTFVVKEDDTSHAFDVLKAMIKIHS